MSDLEIRARAAAAAELALHALNQGPTNSQKTQASFGGRMLQGLRDPIDASAQLLTHALPQSVVNAGNAANNWIADKTGLVGRLPLGGIDQELADQERQYQAARAAAGNTGIDAARIAGNVLSPVNLAIASKVPAVIGKAASALPSISRTAPIVRSIEPLLPETLPQVSRILPRIAGRSEPVLGALPNLEAAAAPTVTAAKNIAPAAIKPSLAGRLGTAAGTGAVYGATNAPVTEGDFATEKLKQVGLGAAMGPTAELIGGGAARLINPKTNDAVKKLISEGIIPTPGQILGGRWQVAEDKLQSVPILGDVIATSRGKSLDELNRAAYRRALEPIGGKMPDTVGREGIASVREQIGKAYDDLLPKVTFKADQQFSADIQTLQGMTSFMAQDQAKRFDKILRDVVITKLGPQGTMDGAALKGVESQLGELSSGLKRDSLFDNRQLGAAIGEIQAAIRSNLERVNPQYAEELGAANKSWANYVRLRDAASRQGAEKGKFTPSQLSAAVRAQDKSKGKRAFSEGTALMQDLSDPAKSVLASKYPDSGSIGRLLMGLGVGGGAAWVNPTAAGLGAIGTLPYLPGGRAVAAALLARRPEVAEPIANKVRQLGPAMSPALIQLLKPTTAQPQN